jgi:hypothetical protein
MSNRAQGRSKSYSQAYALSHRRGRLLSAQRKALLVFSLVVLCIGTALAVSVLGRPPELDAFLCLRSSVPPTHLVVLIDPTDSLTPDEVYTVRRELQRRVETLKPGDRFSLLAIQPQPQGLVTESLFSRCRPRDGTDANPLTENQALLQKRYREAFEEPLARALTRLGELPGAHTSPIMESLYEVATLREFAFVPGARRTLLLVSDLLQHTPKYSQYSPAVSTGALPPSVVAEVQGTLAGVDVLVLLRTSPAMCPWQTPAHARLWETYMQQAGVTSYQVKKVQECAASPPSAPKDSGRGRGRSGPPQRR